MPAYSRDQITSWTLIPEQWENLALQIPYKLPRLQDSNGSSVTFDDLAEIYTEECVRIELFEGDYGQKAQIAIPGQVIDEYRKYRPTPLVRAHGLERHLNYQGRIFYKREDCNPTGSHKPNTAIPQSYYARSQGLSGLITDTGAGQWGTALAWSCHNLGLRCTVFMTRSSYDSKPYRRHLMSLCGADVHSSPSDVTEPGRMLLDTGHDHSGSLGIGMSEALALVRTTPGTRLALGCVSYYAAMHQTVIGQELEQQLRLGEIAPDYLIGCVGGGTNFIGFVAPFLTQASRGDKRSSPQLVAVESLSIPVLTKGEYRYDSQDRFGLTPSVQMYTLGRDFVSPEIHAGGLRYHGKSPLLSLMIHEGLVTAVAIDQEEAFRAGRLFFESEGVLPAPESSHAIAQVLRQIKEDIRRDAKSTIVFCLSGTGYLDLSAYAKIFKLAD